MSLWLLKSNWRFKPDWLRHYDNVKSQWAEHSTVSILQLRNEHWKYMYPKEVRDWQKLTENSLQKLGQTSRQFNKM